MIIIILQILALTGVSLIVIVIWISTLSVIIIWISALSVVFCTYYLYYLSSYLRVISSR
jgi:hypothetical protein